MRRIRVRTGGAAVLAGVLALVVAGAVVGFRDRPGGSGSTAIKGIASVPAASTAAGDAKAQLAAPAPGPTPAPAPVPPPDGGGTAVVPGSPRIVHTADLRVQVAKGGFGAAFDRVAAIATANGGFVSASSTATADHARSGDLTVRVPSDRFDAARQALAGLGTVQGESIRGEDVSGQLVDYGARLKSLQAQEDALRTILGQAKAVGDVLSVQSSLFTVRQQIEQLTAQQANLQQSTTLATIQVSLFEPGAATVVRPVDDRSLAHSVRRAVDASVTVLGGMVVVVGWLVPVGVLGLLVWGGTRVLRRRPAPPAQVPTA